MSRFYDAAQWREIYRLTAQKTGEDALLRYLAAETAKKIEARLAQTDNKNVVILAGSGVVRALAERLCAILMEHGTDTVLSDFSDFLTNDLTDFGLIVDALCFQDGLPDSRMIDSLFGLVERSGVPVISLGIPSGADPSSGRVQKAFKAQETISFLAHSVGCFVYPAADFCGRVTLIGHPAADLLQTPYLSTDEIAFDEIEALKRFPRAHKGTYGCVGVLAGSADVAGACCFTASAAYQTGAGLVRILTHERCRVMLQTHLPEALLKTFDDSEFSDRFAQLSFLLPCTTLAAGPGMGVDSPAETRLSRLLENTNVPTVLDADALTLLSIGKISLPDPSRIVLTPHMGEAGRLLGISAETAAASPLDTLTALNRKFGCTVVLKDAHTLICGGDKVYINQTGNDGMATGGSGDLLAGICASLIRNAVRIDRAAAYAAYIHGLCGDLAAKKYGKHAMLASHILKCLPDVLTELCT